MISCLVWLRLVSVGFSLRLSISQYNTQSLPHHIKLCVEHLFVGAQVHPLCFLLRVASCDACPCIPCIDSRVIRSEGYLVPSICMSSRLLCLLLFDSCKGGYISGKRLRLYPLDVFRSRDSVDAGALHYCSCKPLYLCFSPPVDRFEPVFISFRQLPWLSLLLSLPKCHGEDVTRGLRSRDCE